MQTRRGRNSLAVAAAMALLATALLAGPGLAQDVTGEPIFGSVKLAYGFTPDPHVMALSSGGMVDTQASLGGACRGWIASFPDYLLRYSAGTLPLIISVDADADTTLVINAPDGKWYCDDDSGEGLNPSYRFEIPVSGDYHIWVGTYSNSEYLPASLYISELNSQ